MVPGWPVLLAGWVFFGYLAKALWMSSLPLLVLTHTKQKHGLASPGGAVGSQSSQAGLWAGVGGTAAFSDSPILDSSRIKRHGF